jgi:hypothetical protein
MAEPVKIAYPPGVYRNGTQYQAAGRWYNSNWVRWLDGQIRPIGGWNAVASGASGKARAMLSWTTNAAQQFIAIGTSSHLYVYDGDGSLYNITPSGFVAGYDDTQGNTSYGGGLYGSGNYGVVRPATGAPVMAAVWDLDNFGDYLLGVSAVDGHLYEWLDNTASLAVATTGAPTGNIGVLVTDQRHVMLLGAGGNFRTVQWSDVENRNQWTPAATNEAGQFNLQTNGQIMCGRKINGQVLVLTTTDAHILTYQGQPYIWGKQKCGSSCGVISRGAAAATSDFVAWMGTQRFWAFYSGTVTELPSDVSDYVFSNLNRSQAAKVTCGHLGTLGEIWWFYPSGSSTENDSYVIWNYREQHWAIGQLPRTAWIDAGAYANPYAMDTSGNLMQHESGYTNNGAARLGNCFASGGAIEIGNGEYVQDVEGILADEVAQGQVGVSFVGSRSPTGPPITYGPYTIRSDGYMDCRFSDRQVEMTVMGVVDADWRVGYFRLFNKPAGKR